MIKKLQKVYLSYKPQFIYLLILLIILIFLSGLPYFNLILSQTFIFSLLWLVSIFLFKLSGRFSIKMALVFWCFCPLLLFLKQERLAEEIGNLVYWLFLIGVIQEFIAYKF